VQVDALEDVQAVGADGVGLVDVAQLEHVAELPEE
jgi:hypothetical protein